MGALLPAPDGKDALSAAFRRALEGLLKDDLAEERRAREADVVWREDNGARFAIYATEAGFAAVGATPPAARKSDAAEAATKRPGGKLGQVLDAVEGPEGASLNELVAATAWQPHTTRAVITRLRQRGYDIRLTDGGRAESLPPAGRVIGMPEGCNQDRGGTAPPRVSFRLRIWPRHGRNASALRFLPHCRTACDA